MSELKKERIYRISDIEKNGRLRHEED